MSRAFHTGMAMVLFSILLNLPALDDCCFPLGWSCHLALPPGIMAGFSSLKATSINLCAQHYGA